MIQYIRPRLRIQLFMFLLVACTQSPELPTRVNTAVAPLVPSPSAGVAEVLPPPTYTPTTVPTPSPTPVVATVTPTPGSGPAINITTPPDDAFLSLDTSVTAAGLAQLGSASSISITLKSATGHLLSEVLTTPTEVGSWQVELSIPVQVSGPAELQAFLLSDSGDVLAFDTKPVKLFLDPAGIDRYLDLYRPDSQQNGVAGYHLFFDGRAVAPVNNVVTISIWSEQCQTLAARQSFELSGSGYWQGFVVVPRDITGEICAVAHFGQPGDESWRESSVEVSILSTDDEASTGVLIGNPPPDRVIAAGQSLLLYGTAYNAPDETVNINIMLENGRVLTEGVASVDFFGYWELELFIPENASGPAQITAVVGGPSQEGSAQDVTLIEIAES